VSTAGPGLVVLYRWKLRAGLEASFVDAWSQVTAILRKDGGSLGSRLHRGDDGIWYGYAQWPSEAVRQDAFGRLRNDTLGARMRAAIESSLPEVVLESVADYLILPAPEQDACGNREGHV
jgi:hypothetical protein